MVVIALYAGGSHTDTQLLYKGIISRNVKFSDDSNWGYFTLAVNCFNKGIDCRIRHMTPCSRMVYFVTLYHKV